MNVENETTSVEPKPIGIVISVVCNLFYDSAKRTLTSYASPQGMLENDLPDVNEEKNSVRLGKLQYGKLLLSSCKHQLSESITLPHCIPMAERCKRLVRTKKQAKVGECKSSERIKD